MGVIQTIGNGYQIMGAEAKQNIVNNRANILTGVSVLGTIATGVVSAFAGAKSARQIDAKAAEVQRPLTTKEKAKLCWKNFIAPVGIAAGSSAGAISSNRIMAGDIARLTTDVAVVTKAYNEFKKASNEVISEKQQNEIKQHIAEEKRKDIKPGEFERLPDCSGGADLPQLFVDGFNTDVKFISTVDKVNLAIAECRTEMAELTPRVRPGYSPVVHGVHWSSFLKRVGAMTPIQAGRGGTIIQNYGWNKGYLEEDGTNTDDIISCYFSPGETEYMGQLRSCYILVWDQDPTDMKLGDILKNSSV